MGSKAWTLCTPHSTLCSTPMMGSKAWTLCTTPSTLCRRFEVYGPRGRDGVQILGPKSWALVLESVGPEG